MLGCRFRMSVAAIAVALVIMIAAVSLPLLFIDFRTVAVNDVQTVAPDGSERLYLQVTATVGELEVVFLPLGGEAVRIVSSIRGEANLFGKESPLRTNVTSETSIDGAGSMQAVNVTLNTYAPWPHYSLRSVNFTIAIDEGLRTRLNLSVTTGGITLRTADSVILEGLELNSTAKGAAVSLENGTVVAGDIRIQTATGGSMLSWNNVTVNGPRNLTVVESSGPIFAYFDQHRPMVGSVSMRVVDTVGEVRLGFDLSGSVSARVDCGWSLGEPEVVDNGGFSGTPARFLSDNHPGVSPFNVQVNQTLGNVHIEGRWNA